MIQIDMPMPDNCLECRFSISEFGYCNAMPVEFVGQVSDYEDGKPEWCPLKAQEARLVTEADFENADPYGYLPVWVENKDDSEIVCDCITKTAITDPDDDNHYRFWTSRPIDAQREKEPWNG